MPTLLYYSKADPAERWREALEAEMPELELRFHPEIGDPAEIDYALVFKAPPGLLASLPNLKAIFSITAGIDHFRGDPELPAGVPIVRMIDDYLQAMMAEYAIYAVLHFHRFFDLYRMDQRAGTWRQRWPHYTPETGVGVLGLGAIGREVARKLSLIGFDVHGWAMSEKAIEGVRCYSGEAGLAAMLPHCRYLIAVLPLTDGTAGIIDAGTMAAMPKGSYVVNIGRGGLVVDEHLLAALDSGQLAGAFLDVFHEEPLPAGHPYWSHPKVWMTPHIAGEIVPRSCARVVADNIRRQLAGAPMHNLVTLDRGY